MKVAMPAIEVYSRRDRRPRIPGDVAVDVSRTVPSCVLTCVHHPIA